MKRTLIVATTSYAGMGPYVSEIVNTFSPNDDVYFFFHDYEDDFFKKNVKKELHEKSIFYKEANSINNKLHSLFFKWNKYDKCLLKICKKNGISLVHYLNGTPSISMQNRYKIMGVQVVVTVHDLIPHETKKAWHKQFRQRIIYKRQAENLAVVKSFITNSKYQFELLNKKFKDCKIAFHDFPSLVTETIIDGNEIPKELESIVKPYILFFGRIEEYKGISLLYKAFVEDKRINEDYNLVIAGGGDLNLSKPYHKNVVIINRYIKDSEIAYLYKNASCVVYPYISATQSGVMSLAFYFNIPVVASDVPFFKGIIEQSNTGLLFKKGDVDDLKEKLHSIMTMNCSEIKQSQQKYYQENYDGSSIRKSLLSIYEKH